MRGRRGALHTLVGAYVMDAVTGRDQAGFERHLLSCEQCQDDVRGLREATAHLAAAAAVAPRPELREQTMRSAERIRQLPPFVPGQPARHGGRVRARSWLPRLVAGAAIVLAVIAIFLGVHASTMQARLGALEQRDSAITAILGSHDATMLTADVRTGGTATVVMSHRARALVFTASGLTRLPTSKVYELWLMGPGGPTPAGMLPSGHHGMSGPVVVNQLAPGDRLGLTIEPSAGTGRPTSALVVLVALGP
jgi:anti-sigma factor RsiW